MILKSDNIEDIILSRLISDEFYLRNVLPYLKDDYFTDTPHTKVYNLIREYFDEYNGLPSMSALHIELQNSEMSQGDYDACKNILEKIESTTDANYDWVREKTEKFCQDRAVYNAIMESIQILDGQSKQDKGAITQILEEALSVSFDTHIGHDFLEDFEDRYDFYHRKIERIPFDLEMMNKITKKGIPRKTLNMILAGTGVGKTLMMCHFASANLMEGKNVLYITLEMAEERIAERIDANLMHVQLNELEQLPKDSYETKLKRIRDKTSGKLVIKEYPTASVGAGHFRHLLNELKSKKKFTPDIIYIDYLNLCISSRMKMGANVNSYTLIKSIAEELRGLAVEYNLPIFSATQTNRTGFTNSDVGLEDTSESFGLPATADFMIAAISSEELEDMNQIMIKQLKNRYNDPATNRRFVLGIDKARMKLYDVDNSVSTANVDTQTETPPLKSKFDKDVFNDWK
jgi:replicative DNA helicase